MSDVNLLSDLSNVSATGLAVSMAYLGLQRFRYRDEIEEVARATKKRVDTSKADDTLDQIKNLRWLCREPTESHVPDGFSAKLYHHVFRRKVDEALILMLAFTCFLSLFTSSALDLGIWSWVGVVNDTLFVSVFFYAALLAVVVPAVAVVLGRRCVSWGISYADHCEDQIEKILVQSARTVSVPNIKNLSDE